MKVLVTGFEPFGGEKGKCHRELFYKNKETVVSKDGGR